MNENNNSAVAEVDADSFLAQGLANTQGVDTSGFHTQPAADDNTTEKISNEDRGTQDPADSNQTDPKGSDQASATTSETEVKDNAAGKVSKGRAVGRIQQLLDQVKERDAKIAEYERAKTAQNPTTATQATTQKAETPIMVAKPEYDAKTLEGLLERKQLELDEHLVNGDLPKIRETRQFMKAVNEKLQEALTWESRNKAAVDQYNNATAHYRNEVLKQWPDMAKEGSPIRQEHAKVHARFLEVQKNPALYEHELASIASLRLRVAGVAALENQIKELQGKLATYEKKHAPLKQEEAPGSGSSNTTDDPDADLLRGIRAVMPRGR